MAAGDEIHTIIPILVKLNGTGSNNTFLFDFMILFAIDF